jgi:hypothetical protein
MLDLGGGIRAWIFRILVLAAGGLLVWTWLHPWWTFDIRMLYSNVVVIYPHDLVINVPEKYMSYIKGAQDVLPQWFYTFMWIYFGLCIAGLLYAVFFKIKNIKLIGKHFNLNRLIVGLVGVSYIVIVVAAILVINANVKNYFDTPLQGAMYIELAEDKYSDAYSTLTQTYWLACVVGPVLFVLALLRNIIAGRPKQVD